MLMPMVRRMDQSDKENVYPLHLFHWVVHYTFCAVFYNRVLFLMTLVSPRRKPATSPRRRSPITRRGGSPRRPPDSPPRRRPDSPVRRRLDSPYRRGDTPPRRRPTSPGRGRSSTSPRRNRSPARFTTNNYFSGLMSFLILIAFYWLPYGLLQKDAWQSCSQTFSTSS